MSHANNLHDLLSTNSYNLEKIKYFLEFDRSSINNKKSRGSTPLIEVLKDTKCSIGIVRLLLHYGADVNVRGDDGRTPLLFALCFSRDETIIEALLEKGAEIVGRDLFGQTPLSYLFKNCHWDLSSKPKPEWKENVLNLLLGAGLDLNKVGVNGRSPLCYALWEGADVRDIELLLSKGGSLNACQKHAFPLHCLTDFYLGALLKASVVQFLLDKQAHRKGEVFEMGLQPLQHLLSFHQYETTAIKLLLEHSDGNAINTWIQQKSDVLHLVVESKYCKPSIVKLFLQRGACLDKPNALGETVLHTALKNSSAHDVSVIEFLIKSGAPVNVKSKDSETPLSLAISQGRENYLINLLLAFGARFGVSCYQNGMSLLVIALSLSLFNRAEKSVFKTLVKYYFLEFPDFIIHRLINGHPDYESLSVFAAKCADELQRMELKNVRSDCTLRRFISGNFLLGVNTDHEKKVAIDDCNRLLKILSSDEFPEFFDVIASKILASKVADVFLKENLKELVVFAVNHCPVDACLIKKAVLNYDDVCKLAKFLSDKELLHLIVAFYHADDLSYNNTPKKRNLGSRQLITKFEKRMKL